MPLPLLIGGGALLAGALKGGLGVGIGYGASNAMGHDDYDLYDAGLDFGLGAFSIPGAGSLTRGARLGVSAGQRAVLPGAVAAARRGFSSGFGGLNRLTAAKLLGKGAGMSLIPVTIGGGSTVAADGTNYPKLPPRARASAPVATSGGTFPALTLPTVTPVAINYTPGAAPSFHKTLKDYLADKQLQGLVAQQIFATNKPLLDANQKTKRQREGQLKQNDQLGAGLQQQYAKRIADQTALTAELAARNAAKQQVLDNETAAAQAAVPMTYTGGELANASAQAQEAAANEQALADNLVDRLASEGKAYLEALQAADAQQAKADAEGIKTAAAENIATNTAQIRANQAQRGTLLGTLAAEQYKNAIDLHNLAVQNYNNTEDRRFQQASDNAKLQHDANTANAQLGMDLIDAASSGESGGKKYTPFQKRGLKVLDQLAKELAKARVTEVKTPKGTMEIDHKKIKRIKHAIAQAKKTYGL